MAARGSTKALSVEQEDYVAKQYRGRRSKSSGASPTDLGDVRVDDGLTLIECKGKFGERTGAKPVRSTLVSQLEKVWDEAVQGGRDAMLALRFYMPGSPLADSHGYVDLSVRLMADDVLRSEQLRDLSAQAFDCDCKERWT